MFHVAVIRLFLSLNDDDMCSGDDDVPVDLSSSSQQLLRSSVNWAGQPLANSTSVCFACHVI